MRLFTKVALVVACIATVLTPSQASSAPGCADPVPGSGDWSLYGGALDNARNQWAETEIGAENVANLAPKWIFDASSEVPNGGGFSNTPVVVDGCAYLASNTGWVFAVNAENGELLWETHLQGGSQALLGGVIVGSVAVHDGVVFAGVSQPGAPYLAALDQATGQILWFSELVQQPSAAINASPVPYVVDGRSLVFQGFFGNEGTDHARGGYAIVDASPSCDGCPVNDDGVPMKAPEVREYTIPDEDYEAGYRGASVWTTAAIDPATGYIFVGGGNPASKTLEHRHSNALMKIDGDPSRETYGKIVDAYKGNVDQYFPGADRQPICELFGEDLVYVAWSLACLQLDLDFGASPNLFYDSHGRQLLGALQKSGVYHVVYTDNMQLAWSQIVGAPCFACNAASSAFDEDKIFVATTPNGQMVSITKDAGKYRWVSPTADQIHFQSTSAANGLVYTMDTYANLRVFDAETGLPLATRSFTADTGDLTTDSGSAGVAIARNNVFAASSNYVIAYGI